MRKRYQLPLVVCLLVCFGVVGVLPADAAMVKKRNFGQLMALGDEVIVGKITRVSDGFDGNNVPYTEVTIEVRETPKGSVSGTYKFRQFGLISPRDMGDGYTNLNVTLDGWPTYSQGEDVVLFLYKAATWTGLRTTVGLFQGKFVIEDGYVVNTINNEGLFDGVRVDPRQLDDKERAMLAMKKGKIPEDVFMSFMRKSADQQWFKELGGE